MARRESDREDLIAEATALVRRAELSVGYPEPVAAGFRRDGGLSVYFGPDLAYHLDPDGRLKRAYRDGRLYRTQGDTLAELIRERTETQTILRRRDLSSEDRDAFLAELTGRFGGVLSEIDEGRASVLRAVPAGDATFLVDLAAALRDVVGSDLSDRLAPRFKGKR